MPKALEKKLKKEYGSKSKIPYKIMNKMGVMNGNQKVHRTSAKSAASKSGY